MLFQIFGKGAEPCPKFVAKSGWGVFLQGNQWKFYGEPVGPRLVSWFQCVEIYPYRCRASMRRSQAKPWSGELCGTRCDVWSIEVASSMESTVHFSESFTIFHMCTWIIMDHHGSSWIIMDHHGSSWIIVDHGTALGPQEVQGRVGSSRQAMSLGLEALNSALSCAEAGPETNICHLGWPFKIGI